MSKTRQGPHQARDWPPSPYEEKLARTLEEIYGAGTYDLAGVVARLNQTQVSPPEGGQWSEASFAATMKKLGE